MKCGICCIIFFISSVVLFLVSGQLQLDQVKKSEMWEFLIDNSILKVPSDNTPLQKNTQQIFTGPAQCVLNKYTSIRAEDSKGISNISSNIEMKTQTPTVFRSTMFQMYIKVAKTKSVNGKTTTTQEWEWKNQYPNWETTICQSPSFGDHTVHEREHFDVILTGAQNDSESSSERTEINAGGNPQTRFLIDGIVTIGQDYTLIGIYKGKEFIDAEKGIFKYMQAPVKTGDQTTQYLRKGKWTLIEMKKNLRQSFKESLDGYTYALIGGMACFFIAIMVMCLSGNKTHDEAPESDSSSSSKSSKSKSKSKSSSSDSDKKKKKRKGKKDKDS